MAPCTHSNFAKHVCPSGEHVEVDKDGKYECPSFACFPPTPVLIGTKCFASTTDFVTQETMRKQSQHAVVVAAGKIMDQAEASFYNASFDGGFSGGYMSHLERKRRRLGPRVLRRNRRRLMPPRRRCGWNLRRKAGAAPAGHHEYGRQQMRPYA
jgi:hypothetical protein